MMIRKIKNYLPSQCFRWCHTERIRSCWVQQYQRAAPGQKTVIGPHFISAIWTSCNPFLCCMDKPPATFPLRSTTARPLLINFRALLRANESTRLYSSAIFFIFHVILHFNWKRLQDLYVGVCVCDRAMLDSERNWFPNNVRIPIEGMFGKLTQ